jgi:hypothetical protein
MKEDKQVTKLSCDLQLRLCWDFGLAISLSTFIAGTSTLFIAYSLGYVEGQDKFETLYRTTCNTCINITGGGNFFHTLNALHLGITLALIISAVGLWSRKVIGLFLSLIASISIFGIYIWWYLDTLHFLRYTVEVPMNDPYYKEVGLLHGALSWDRVVLIVAIVLFTWELKTLMRTLRNSRINVN